MTIYEKQLLIAIIVKNRMCLDIMTLFHWIRLILSETIPCRMKALLPLIAPVRFSRISCVSQGYHLRSHLLPNGKLLVRWQCQRCTQATV